MKKKHDAKDIEKNAMTWMEEKYGESFALVDGGVDYNAGTYLMHFRSESHPEFVIQSDFYIKAEAMTDDYASYLRKDEIVAYYEALFQEVYGAECKVFFGAGVQAHQYMNDTFDPNQPIEEFLQHNGRNVITVYTTAKLETKDSDFETVKQKLLDLKIPTGDFISYVTPETYSILTQETRRQIVEEKRFIYKTGFLFSATMKPEDMMPNWREGNEIP